MTHDDYLELSAMIGKIYLTARYCLISLFMTMGIGFYLAYQSGRRK